MHPLASLMALAPLLACGVSWSQDAPAAAASAVPAPGAARIAKVRAIAPRPDDPDYPAAVIAKGVHGTVEVLAQVGPDGVPTAVSVANTSRSKELDEAGLAVVKALKFGVERTDDGARAAGASAPVSAPASAPMRAMQVLVPVAFSRDTVATLRTKTCREFSVDAEYFRATFPERAIGEMPVLKTGFGLLMMSTAPRMTPEALGALSKKTNAATAGIVQACASAPDSGFLQVFRDLADKAGG